MSEICEHSSGDGAENHCDLVGYPVSRRVCANCSKNTAKGVWPSAESLSVVLTISATLRNLPLDPNALANIQLQRPGDCCGDSPLEGI